MKRYLKDVDPAVFWGSAALIAGFVGWGSSPRRASAR